MRKAQGKFDPLILEVIPCFSPMCFPKIIRTIETLDKEKFESRLKDKVVPKDVQSIINDELEKLSVLEPLSSEYAVARSYLDWLTIIPWGVMSLGVVQSGRHHAYMAGGNQSRSK